MELLLNLAWLLLALPAYYVWRDSRCAHARRKVSSAQCIFALGCMLVVLFPVVSATDDLHAMRAELEESPSSKRSICQRGSDKPSFWKWQAQPSIASISFPLLAELRSSLDIPQTRSLIQSRNSIQPTGRAPPVSTSCNSPIADFDA